MISMYSVRFIARFSFPILICMYSLCFFSFLLKIILELLPVQLFCMDARLLHVLNNAELCCVVSCCIVPFRRVEMRFHVFDLLEMKRHVRSENNVDDHASELSETKRSTTVNIAKR